VTVACSKPEGAENSPLYRQAARVILVLAYFLYFAWGGLFANFAPDDMMNLAGYWEQGPWRAVASQFLVGSNAYRPMGALFYLPLFTVFGLNPLPFRIVVFLLLLANVGLAYRAARVLGADGTAATLAALVICYHAGLSDLHYSTAAVYDVLCFFFYFIAFLYYARIRRRPGAPGVRETVVFLALYLCALNSKEMAVTLPVMLLAYEWLYCGRRCFLPAVAAGLLTAVYIAGKQFGPDPLMAQEAYRPVFTLARYLESSRLHLNELFYGGTWFTTRRALLLWAAITWVAWRRQRPVLRFAWLLALVGPLPVVFLQGRTHSCLYIPLAGWAVLVAVAFTDAAGALAGWLERLPRIGRAGRRAWFAAMVAAAGILLAGLTAAKKRKQEPAIAAHGALTAAVIGEFRAADPKVPPHSRVLLVDDPFHDWDAKFIAQLWFRDRSVDVRLQNKTPMTAEEIAREVQFVFRFERGRLVRVKP